MFSVLLEETRHITRCRMTATLWRLLTTQDTTIKRDQRHNIEHHICFLPKCYTVYRVWSTSHIPWRQTWRCQFRHTKLPFRGINIPYSPAYGDFISFFIRYAPNWSSYDFFILIARRLLNKLLKKGYIKERLIFRKLYGRYCNLISKSEVSLWQLFNDIFRSLTSCSYYLSNQTFHQFMTC